MKTLRHKIKKAAEIWRGGGLRGFRRHLKQKFAKSSEAKNFQKWIRRFDQLTDEDRRTIRHRIEKFPHKPLISVVMPVYNVEEKWLRLCVESVLKQLYENWEFCIADDCSPSPHVRRVLEEYAARDERIKLVFRETNGHISAASNSALELATGDFVALLDHDDELSEHALFYVVGEINDFPEAALIYSDENLIDENGRRYAPNFKPDWSRDYFYSLNLVTHLAVFRRDILQKIGGFRLGSEGSQDYDLVLRVIEQISEKNIRHIPKILYHWRAIQGSVALGSDEKPYAHERAREAIGAHFERTGKEASVGQTVYNLHRVRYELPQDLPKVSLILLADENFQFTRRALKTFIEETDYQNLEVVVVCSETVKTKIETKAYSEELKIIVCESGSEAAKYNLAVSETGGDVLCFADLNLKPQSKDWLKEMVSFAVQKEIGAVGAKILDADERVLHGGLIVGAGDAAGVAHKHLPRGESGYSGRAQVINNFSAVSISCLAIRRETFDKTGGFDAENFPNKLYDVDFCLRLGEENLRVVFTPYAELMRVDKGGLLNVQKKPNQKERDFFVGKWRSLIEKDSFYNPNFSYRDGNFSIKI